MAEPARFTPSTAALIVKPKSVRAAGGLPPEIEHDPALMEAVSTMLPRHYNFEIAKTVWKLREARAKRVALQFPEGLLLYACTIADILTTFTGAEAVVMGDVTYGACCVDDLSAAALGADFLVHYGHSCLVPIDQTAASVRMLYVFVDIAFDESHLRACIVDNFRPDMRLGVLGTIQFAPTLHSLKAALAESHPHLVIPQAKPLSPGEVLGCTSPDLSSLGLEAYVFVADGRFHLESVMVHNPDLPAYRYDPYTKLMTREHYDTPHMMSTRRAAIETATGARSFGLILGTLGRQGNTALLKRLQDKLTAAGRQHFVLLLSEISPAKLALFTEIEAWVQVACPRLSIDWGAGFAKPMLTPYEAEVCLGLTAWRTIYPMDYYARGSGPWTNYHKPASGTSKATAPPVVAVPVAVPVAVAASTEAGGGGEAASEEAAPPPPASEAAPAACGPCGCRDGAV